MFSLDFQETDKLILCFLKSIKAEEWLWSFLLESGLKKLISFHWYEEHR